MANFQTHLSVGCTVSSFAALALYDFGMVGTSEAQWLFVIGTGASLAPDLDSNHSRPVRAFFFLLGILLGFAIAFALAPSLPLLALLVIWLGVWLFVRYPLFMSFAYFTVHRGVWHSLLMAVVLALAAATVAEYWFDLSAVQSWHVAGFVIVGYVTHLLLDELASVDLAGVRLKRSFGTALKLFSPNLWSVVLLFLLILLLGISPSPAPIADLLAPLGLNRDLLINHWPRW